MRSCDVMNRRSSQRCDAHDVCSPLRVSGWRLSDRAAALNFILKGTSCAATLSRLNPCIMKLRTQPFLLVWGLGCMEVCVGSPQLSANQA